MSELGYDQLHARRKEPDRIAPQVGHSTEQMRLLQSGQGVGDALEIGNVAQH